MMSNNHTSHAYQSLKKAGFMAEQQLNQNIQTRLNDERLLQRAHDNAQLYAKVVEKLQNRIEALSIPFNFPTKRDAASIAKLIIQTEEKVDRIEEKVMDVSASVDELKKMVHDLSRSGTYTSSRAGHD